MNEAAIKTYLGDDTVDPIRTIMDRLNESRFFSETEVGFFHPVTSAIIKLKDNGSIDIFTATNQGIRIDRTTSSINFFTNNEKHHIGNISAWVEDSVSLHVKKSIMAKAMELLLELQKLNVIANNGKFKIDKFDVIADEGKVQSGLLNLDVPEETLILAGTTMKELNDRMQQMEDSINENRQMINSLNSSVDSLSGGLNSAFDAIDRLRSRIDDLGDDD